MVQFTTKSDLITMPKSIPAEIKARIVEIVTTLDDNYGEHRKQDEDGGCVVLIADDEDYVSTLKDKWEIEIGVSTFEYVEVIPTDKGNYLDCLILANNDYAITIILKQTFAVEAITNEIDKGDNCE